MALPEWFQIALSRRRLIPWPLAFVVHNLRRVAWSRFVLPVLKVCEIAWQRIRCQICWMGLRNPENFCEHQNSRSRHDSKADQCAKAANTPASHYPWEHLISPVMSLPEFNLLDFSWCLLWFFDVWDVLSPLPPESDWKLPLGRAMARLLSGDCMEIVRYEGKTCSKALRSRSRFSALLIFDLLLLFVFSMHDRWQLFTRYAVSFFCQNISTIHKGGQTNKA